MKPLSQKYYDSIADMDPWECFCCVPAPLSRLKNQLQLVLSYQNLGTVTKEFTGTVHPNKTLCTGSMC